MSGSGSATTSTVSESVPDRLCVFVNKTIPSYNKGWSSSWTACNKLCILPQNQSERATRCLLLFAVCCLSFLLLTLSSVCCLFSSTLDLPVWLSGFWDEEIYKNILDILNQLLPCEIVQKYIQSSQYTPACAKSCTQTTLIPLGECIYKMTYFLPTKSVCQQRRPQCGSHLLSTVREETT